MDTSYSQMNGTCRPPEGEPDALDLRDGTDRPARTAAPKPGAPTARAHRGSLPRVAPTSTRTRRRGPSGRLAQLVRLPGKAAPSREPQPAVTAADLTEARREAEGRQPAQGGWRGGVNRATGVRLAPSKAEAHERTAAARVSTFFDGTRHVVFANPKGGAAKTTTCLGVAAMFGVHLGRGVVAYDNNPTRGTLGLRAERDLHTSTITDLLAEMDQIQRVGDLSRFVRAQLAGHFDVLASDEDPRMAHGRGGADYDAVIRLLDTFYKVVCVDTGNDVTAPVFTAAAAGAHQLVVVTGSAWDSVYTASWMLDYLDEHGFTQLVADAVTVVTLPQGGSHDLAAVQAHFAARTRSVLAVPFDPALHAGVEISLDNVRPTTQRAWLEVAAAVADGFVAVGAGARVVEL